MRKAAVYGLALVCVCMLFALSGPSAQRIVNGDGGGSTSTAPVPVSVANFPTVQAVQVQKPITVTGSVAVTNFPAVQEVAGTVNVGNLPVDADGNVKVSGGHVAVAVLAHFVGTTTTSGFFSGQGTLALSRGCNAEMPGTRVSDWEEIFSTIPPAPLVGSVIVSRDLANSPNGVCINQDGLMVSYCPEPAPIACCGY
jgi:hypothetical protein